MVLHDVQSHGFMDTQNRMNERRNKLEQKIQIHNSAPEVPGFCRMSHCQYRDPHWVMLSNYVVVIIIFGLMPSLCHLSAVQAEETCVLGLGRPIYASLGDTRTFGLGRGEGMGP